ncbi:MAG: MATE family efflux transporter, partial [Leptonema sp. (in: Bacteria)]|nr:MATE family efflux transporter [Leptonema sp. (in: bacteria)]
MQSSFAIIAISFRNLVRRGKWQGSGGYREVLAISIPLILSTSAWSLQMFVDRMFLTWYSQEALAASLPAGLLSVTTTSIFIGTASYVSVFVSQYFGAGQLSRMGSAMWQGIYIAVIGGLLHLVIIPFSPQIFAIFGHEPLVAQYESDYFQMIFLGA